VPTPSPLTQTPMPIRADQPNIQSATHPAITNLERFVIPRFASTSARNAAFTTVSPVQGQLIFITSLNAYQVWNGSQWIEFGSFTSMRELAAVKTAPQARTSTLFTNVSEVSIPVTAGTWKVDVDLHYRAPSANTTFRINFIFPHVDSRMSFGALGRGTNATGGNLNASTMAHDTNNMRVSGNIDSISFGGNGVGDVLYAKGGGTLFCAGSGTLQMQFARGGSSGEVVCGEGTLMTARRIA
jgi:hypothetical protein